MTPPESTTDETHFERQHDLEDTTEWREQASADGRERCLRTVRPELGVCVETRRLPYG